VNNVLFGSAPLNPPGGWVYSSQVLSASGRTFLGPNPARLLVLITVLGSGPDSPAPPGQRPSRPASPGNAVV